MKYVVLKVDGTVEILEREVSIKLRELQELVGGYIEFVNVARNTSFAMHDTSFAMMVNEEGRLLVDEI